MLLDLEMPGFYVVWEKLLSFSRAPISSDIWLCMPA